MSRTNAHGSRASKERSVPVSAVSRWLADSTDGYCAPTTPADGGDCDTGDKGSWPLRASVSRTFVLAARVCLARCLACGSCNFVSLSITQKDCSWHRECPAVGGLGLQQGYRTGRMVREPKVLRAAGADASLASPAGVVAEGFERPAFRSGVRDPSTT